MKRYEILISENAGFSDAEDLKSETDAIGKSLVETIKKYGGDATMSIEDECIIHLTMSDTCMERIKLLSGSDLMNEYSTWLGTMMLQTNGIGLELTIDYTIEWYDMDKY